jgi:hypothetical protein
MSKKMHFCLSFFFFFFHLVLVMEPRVLHMLGKLSTTELHPSPKKMHF